MLLKNQALIKSAIVDIKYVWANSCLEISHNRFIESVDIPRATMLVVNTASEM